MRRWMMSGLLAAGVLGASGAAAQAPAPDADQARLLRLLSHHHATPDRATLAAIPGVAKRLQAVAGDALGFPAQRYAAFEALQHWPDARTRALYTAAVAADQPVGLRHRVLGLWPRAFGAQALPVLQAALADPDAQIRLSAAHAVDALPGGAADKALADALAAEGAPAVRDALAGLITRRAGVR